MSFVSVAFGVLFAVVYVARLTIGRRSNAPLFLGLVLVANLVFYGWHTPGYILLVLFSTVVDFVAGALLGRLEAPRPRRRVLVASVLVNLGLLCFFKYTNFLLSLLPGRPLSQLDIVLPIGISFYTLQSMSYTIDVYRGRIPPTRSFWRFFLYVTFFPQLVAGPIVRARDFLYQLDRPRRLRAVVAAEGLWLFIRGVFLKVVVANNIGQILSLWWAPAALPGADAGVARAMLALFGFQVFCDFAGYSSIARGLAYLLGFRLPVNFNSPFIAGSMRDFWTRWHISLSTWFRDYIYIPLGGNRRGLPRSLLNLFIVFTLSGIWHGAAWTYIAFGMLHGLMSALERALRFHRLPPGTPGWWAWALTCQFFIYLCWGVFRAESLTQYAGLLRNVFSGVSAPGGFPWWLCGMLVAPPILMHLAALLQERGRLPEPLPWAARGVLAGVMLYLILTAYHPDNAFIYFQF